MTSLRKFLLFLVLTILFTLPSQTATARVRLGILAMEDQAGAAGSKELFPERLQSACGNLVAVQSYRDNTTLVNMLTRFGKLEAILITQATYDQQAGQGLSSFAEIKISGNADETGLVLAVQADMPGTLRNQLREGYQELLLSQDGLALLELYASRQNIKPVSLSPPENSKEPAASNPVRAAAAKTMVRTSSEHMSAQAEHILETEPATAAPPHPVSQPRPLTESVSGQDPGLKPVAAKSATHHQATGEPAAAMSSPRVLAAHLEVTSGLEKNLAYGEAELFAPLRQQQDDFLFGDVRLRYDDNHAEEYSLGLGYRKIIDNSWVLGGYAIYDRHVSNGGKSYNQGTLGIEAFTDKYTARTNIYLPENASNVLHYADTAVQENTLRGVEAEFGILLPWVETQEVRGYLGGYRFSASGVEDVNGSSARLEFRFPDILGWRGSRLEISGGIHHDNLKDTVYFVQASGRIPFGQTRTVRRSHFSEQLTEQPQRMPVFILERHILP